MENINIYKKIYSLAKEASNKKTRNTRTDVAYELKEFGITNDSVEVSKLIYEAYLYFNKDNAIKNAFINNDLARSIVEEYQINDLLDSDSEERALELIQKSIGSIEVIVKEMSSFLNVSDKELISKMNESLILSITGSKGAMNVKENAKVVFERYSKTIDYYKDAKDSIKSLIVDFVFLRERVLEMFYQHAFALVDIFGDSIKIVDPDLFNFDQIEWLDTSAMKNKITLEYDSLNKSCGKLIGEITDNFSKSLDRSVKGIRTSKSNKMGMMIAALEMFDHYSSASEKTYALKEEFQTLQSKVKYDVTTIKADLSRLLVIYKTLDELYIPTAEIFFKNSKEVMSIDLTNIINAVYNTNELKSLKSQRDEILTKVTFLEEKIKDRELNISYYTNSIEDMKSTLKEYEPEHQKAKKDKPNKPFFLFNILSFGSLNKSYNRELYEWDRECKPVLKLFKDLQLDLTLHQEDLESNIKEIEIDAKSHKEVIIELKVLNNKIKGAIVSSAQIKANVLPYLESYIKMLTIAKSILNSKLDEKLIKRVQVDKYKKTELPEEVKHQLSLFTDSLRKDLSFDEKATKESLNYIKVTQEEPTDRNKRTKEQDELNEQIKHINDLQNNAVNSGVILLEAWGSYLKNEAEGKIESVHYKEQFEKTEKEFLDRISVVENKANALREIIKQINTSKTDINKKEGLLLLVKISGYSVSNEDIKDMLDGTKILKL